MKSHLPLLILLLLSASACDSIFGSKQDATTREIFEEGRQDPTQVTDDVGYAALTPFWGGFNNPTDVYVGYDELVYVTDADGVHVLDRAGRRFGAPFPLRGAVAVVQDRKLNLYVAARIDTVIAGLDPNVTWDLPAVFKIRGLNGGEPLTVLDTLIHPFRTFDSSRSTTSAERARLVKGSPNSDELVEVTGLAVLGDNTLYVTRRGPVNPTGTSQAPDNTVLIYQEEVVGGVRTDKMRNIGQIRALSPTTPSLASAVGLTAISTFIGPPQRDNLSTDKSFLLAQGDPNQNVPYRVIWINVVETVDGTVYQPNSGLLAQDTSRASRFLYEQNRFTQPADVAFAADGRNFIFVVDAARDSLYMFQSNGLEGVNPPVGSSSAKALIVSFGGTGSGPRQFNQPSGVAYFRQVVFVADKGNGRIARYKLNTDFE